MLTYRREIAALKEYLVSPRTVIKMDANESPFQMPQDIQKGILARCMSASLNRYPDRESIRLRGLLGESSGLSSEQVALGNGSSQLLQLLCYIFGGEGRSIVYPVPSFSMYGTYVNLSGSKGVPIKLSANFSLPVESVIETVKRVKANLLILCNPNNPTGNAMTISEVAQIAQQVSCPVVVDEAYFEFYGQTALELLQKYSNLIIVRTFSKAFGLAAARVGYLFADSEIAALVNKSLLPYNLNVLSLVAAIEIYEKRDLFKGFISKIVDERERVYASLKPVTRLTVFPSVTNFLLIQINDAEKLARKFAAQDIGVRTFPQGSMLENYLRLTIGLPDENDRFLTIIYDCDGVVV